MNEVPQLGPADGALERRCTYDPTVSGKQCCGKPAVRHISWNEYGSESYACAEHDLYAIRRGYYVAPAQCHALTGACGMPGSRWREAGCVTGEVTIVVPERELTEAVVGERASG